MTNLMRWVMYFLLFCFPYFGLLFTAIKLPGLKMTLLILQVLPYILVIMFGLYAAGTVLYRTFTFNECPAAAKELQAQIAEARKDLISKGFVFRD